MCAAEIPLLGGGLQGLLVFRAQESSFYALRGGYVLQGAEELLVTRPTCYLAVFQAFVQGERGLD